MTLNAQLLGGKVYGNILYYFYRSFFQSVCVLGYCVAPINIGALIVAILHNILPFIVKLVLVLACFGWSTFCKYIYKYYYSINWIYEFPSFRTKKSISSLPSVSILLVFGLVRIGSMKIIYI